MTGPHQNQSLVTAGASLETAVAALILVHGRGATAHSIIQLAQEMQRSGVAYLAPQAAGNTWYPNPFTAPVEMNEPGLSSGLQAIDGAINDVIDAGVQRDKVMVLGFSQGACLASEYIARNPHLYGGLAALSGGLIGETIDTSDYMGDLEETPVFFGCSDGDPHIPVERVHVSAEVFKGLNGDVTKRLYKDMGHGVNKDEIGFVSRMVDSLLD